MQLKKILCSIFFLNCFSQNFAADGTNNPLSMTLDWKDAVLAPASLLVQIPAQILFRDMPTTDSLNLVRSELPVFDRFVAGRYSASAGLASDILVLPLCALPTALATWDGWKSNRSLKPGVIDAVVFGEALAFSSALDLMVRSLQVHPRPYVYGTVAPIADRLAGEASGSFYSGHANAAFLAATYLAYTYPIRHPDFEYSGWLWAGSLGTATAVASLRVAAGKHFPSDVIVGAIIGSGFGWTFAKIHLHGATEKPNRLHAMMQWDDLGWHPEINWKF